MEDKRRLLIFGALAVLVGYAAWTRYAILADTPFAVGIDGYFYAVQLRGILEHGTLSYPDFPFAFYLLAPFAAVTDPIVGAKVGAAVLTALAVLPAYGIGVRLGKSRGAGLLAATIVATSAGGSFLVLEFVKNGVGVTLALTAVWLGLRACEVASRRRIVVAIIAALVACLTHKTAGALVLLVAAPAALAAASERGVLFGRRLLYSVVAFVVVALVGGIAVGAHAFVMRTFTSQPHVTAPAFMVDDTVILTMGYEPLIGIVVAIAAMFGLRGTRSERAASYAFIALGILIGQPFLAVDDPQGLGLRLRVIAFVPLAFTACIVGIRIPERFRSIVLTIIAAGVLVLTPLYRAEGRIIPHPAMVTSVLAMHVPAGVSVAVPERQVMFMIAWYTRIPVHLEPSGEWRALTLAFIGKDSALDHRLMEARREPSPPVGLHPLHPNGFVLVPEATWRRVVQQLPDEERAHATAWPTL